MVCDRDLLKVLKIEPLVSKEYISFKSLHKNSSVDWQRSEIETSGRKPIQLTERSARKIIFTAYSSLKIRVWNRWTTNFWTASFKVYPWTGYLLSCIVITNYIFTLKYDFVVDMYVRRVTLVTGSLQKNSYRLLTPSAACTYRIFQSSFTDIIALKMKM